MPSAYEGAHTKERILWRSSVQCFVMCTRLRSSLDNFTSRCSSVLMTAKETSEEQDSASGMFMSHYSGQQRWPVTTRGMLTRLRSITAFRLCLNLHDFPSRWEISSHILNDINTQIKLYVTSKARSRCRTDLSRQATSRRELGIGSTLPCDSREEMMRYQEAPNDEMEK